MGKPLRIWLWASVAMAIGGALLLFPVGSAAGNLLFAAMKVGMVSGLLTALFCRRRGGLVLWSVCSAGAVACTLLKWSLAGHGSLLLVVSIAADVGMPLMAWHLLRREAS